MLVSNTDQNESFTVEIERKIKSLPHMVTDDAWIQFLQDHYQELKEHSTYIQLTEAILYRYRYRISDYLLEQHNLRLGPEQAFRVVNRLHNDMDFNLGLLGVWVPDISYVTELRHRYSTNIAMSKRN